MNRRNFGRLAAAAGLWAGVGRASWATDLQSGADDPTLEARWRKLDVAIRGFWDKDLQRADEDAVKTDPKKSLLFLPFPFISGSGSEGTFPELYGWDTHFTNLALIEHGRLDIVRGNIMDHLFLIERVGKVPNSNRTWHIMRGQPPLTAWSVGKYLAVKPEDEELAMIAYPLLAREYNGYWQSPGHLTPTGLSTCRDDHPAAGYTAGMNAECECGEDMSPLFDAKVMDCTPIHLNVALVGMAQELGALALRFGWKDKAAMWQKEASLRAARIDQYTWDAKEGFYFEYDFVRQVKLPYYSLNAFWPMWLGLASKEQARRTVEHLGKFEQPHGLAFTDKAYPSPHPSLKLNQWMYPESWPPMEVVTAQALARYGYHAEAQRVGRTYLENVVTTWETSGHLWERYNAVEGGHEVPIERHEPRALHGWSTASAVLVGRVVFAPVVAG